MNYIGIDNGVSGALAEIDASGQLVDWIKMPIQRNRKGLEIDAVALHGWLQMTKALRLGSITVIIEEPGGAKSYKAAVSMAGAFHAARAVLDVLGIRYHRITPQSWQKRMLRCNKKQDTKPAALILARQLWPDENWLRSDRCTTPHDGAIDAALIAEYARRIIL